MKEGDSMSKKCTGTAEGCSALGSSREQQQKSAKRVTEGQKSTVIFIIILFNFAKDATSI